MKRRIQSAYFLMGSIFGGDDGRLKGGIIIWFMFFPRGRFSRG